MIKNINSIYLNQNKFAMSDVKIIPDRHEVESLVKSTQLMLRPYYDRLAELAARKSPKYLYSPKDNELTMIKEADTEEEIIIKSLINTVISDLNNKINPK